MTSLRNVDASFVRRLKVDRARASAYAGHRKLKQTWGGKEQQVSDQLH